nr:DUF1579 family protein [Paludisphaera mucosa]
MESLAGDAGEWSGTNTLQDPNTGKPEESPSTAGLTPVLGGRFVRLDYTWAYQGKPQEGSLLIGFDPESAEASGRWVDTWHMGRKVLDCHGTASADGAVVLRGSFAAPPGPDWGWRIEVASGGDGLRIKHVVIDPDGKEDPAAEGVYPRSSRPSSGAGGVAFKAVGPIGDTDANALPVKEIGPAVGYYTQCLGFALVSRDRTTARLRRGEVEIGLAANGEDPEQASCWFAVDDVEALWSEYEAKGVGPGAIDRQEYGGKAHRVFFAKDPYGVCFCFTQPA